MSAVIEAPPIAVGQLTPGQLLSAKERSLATFRIVLKTGMPAKGLPACVRNRMSWRRLVDTLIAGGHVLPHETLTQLIVEDDGIHLCFEIKETK